MKRFDQDMALRFISERQNEISSVLPSEYCFEKLSQRIVKGLSFLFYSYETDTCMVLNRPNSETVFIDLVYSTKAGAIQQHLRDTVDLALTVDAVKLECSPMSKALERLYRMVGFSTVGETMVLEIV